MANSEPKALKQGDLQRMILGPSDYFRTPADVLKRDDLTSAEKIMILLSWEYEQRELEVAEEENMLPKPGAKPDILDLIMHALDKLDPEHKYRHLAPNKQGGEL